MQPSTQVMVAHVNPTPGTTTRCPPYAHMPPPGLCSAPIHLALLVISTEHVESLFPGKNCVSEHPLSFPPSRLDGKRGARFLHRCFMYIMGLLSGCEQAKRRREHALPTAFLCQGHVWEPRTFHNAHERRMVQGSESTHGLTLSGPFRTPCEGTIRAAHYNFTSSPQKCLRTQEFGIRSLDKDGHRQATTNRFRRMANICESIPCA